MTSETFKEFIRGARASSPMLLGTIPIGLILGVTASQAGFSPLDAAFLAGVNFAGGSEFAALSLWSAVPPVLAIALTTWLINSRHIMLGAALTPYLEKTPLPVALAALYLMCDESWAVGMADIHQRRKAGVARERLFSAAFYFGSALTLWSTWWLSAAAGCAATGLIGDLSAWGVKMACPAMFITLTAMMWPGRSRCLPVVASGAVSALLSLVAALPVAILCGILSGMATAYFTEAKNA